jgi:hypothetical protein
MLSGFETVHMMVWSVVDIVDQARLMLDESSRSLLVEADVW